jgi:hypothetical protein
MKGTKNLYTITERVAALVTGVEVVRVNSGFTIEVLADECAPTFKSKKNAAAFLVDLAGRQGVSDEDLREATKYTGSVPLSGLSGWEELALWRLIHPDDRPKKRRKEA